METVRWLTLTFESVNEILWYYHSNETSLAVLSHGTIYLVCISNFWVCGWNPMLLPFKWNLFSSSFPWYNLWIILLIILCHFISCTVNSSVRRTPTELVSAAFFVFRTVFCHPVRKADISKTDNLSSIQLSQLALNDADFVHIKVDLRHVLSQKLSVHSCEVFRKQSWSENSLFGGASPYLGVNWNLSRGIKGIYPKFPHYRPGCLYCRDRDCMKTEEHC